MRRRPPESAEIARQTCPGDGHVCVLPAQKGRVLPRACRSTTRPAGPPPDGRVLSRPARLPGLTQGVVAGQGRPLRRLPAAVLDRICGWIQIDWDPEGLVEQAGAVVGVDDQRVRADAKRLGAFIGGRGSATGAWRGDVSAG